MQLKSQRSKTRLGLAGFGLVWDRALVKLKIESGRGRRSRVWTLAGGAKYGRRDSDFFFAAQRSSFGFVGENQRRSGEGVKWRREVEETACDFGGKRGEKVGPF